MADGSGDMKVVAVGCATPEHRYDQSALMEAFTAYWSAKHHNVERVSRLHRAVQVSGRNLALPLEAYASMSGFGETSRVYESRRMWRPLLCGRARPRTGRPGEVDILYHDRDRSGVPSLDARLIGRVGLARMFGGADVWVGLWGVPRACASARGHVCASNGRGALALGGARPSPCSERIYRS